MKQRLFVYSVFILSIISQNQLSSQPITPEWPDTLPSQEWVSYHLAHPGPYYANPGDPNGAIYYKGRYHLHYIVDVEEPEGGLSWAHVTSTNLVHWKWHPTVLTPSRQGGQEFCSGTAFYTKDDSIPAIIYHDTGTEPNRNYIRIAQDENLDDWGNPKLIDPIDPATDEPVDYWAWWDPDCWVMNDKYYAITGWEDPSLMTSTDLENWTWHGNLFHPDYNGFPEEEIDRSTEDVSCPNMFKLGDKWMLLCLAHTQQSNAKGCSYYLGHFEDGKYLPETHGRMNFHNDTRNIFILTFHAPESMLTPDGRRIMWAWLQCDAVPTGIQSLPRELELSEDGQLRIKPLTELKSLRYNEVSKENITLTSNSDYRFTEPEGKAVEFKVKFKAPLPEEFGVSFLTDPSDNNGVTITAGKNRSDLDISEKHGEDIDVINPAFQLKENEDLTLRVFIDNTVVEIFINGRQAAAVFTYGYWRENPNISLFTRDEEVLVSELKAWNIKSPYNQNPNDLNIESIPGEFKLEQNYPNPFNSKTTIKYALPQNSNVQLIIYDLLGREIRRLIDERQKSGAKTVLWDGRNDNGSRVSSGVYIYRLKVQEYFKNKKFNQIRKLVLIK